MPWVSPVCVCVRVCVCVCIHLQEPSVCDLLTAMYGTDVGREDGYRAGTGVVSSVWMIQCSRILNVF